MEKRHSKIQIRDLHFPYLAKNLQNPIQASKQKLQCKLEGREHVWVVHREMCWNTFNTPLNENNSEESVLPTDAVAQLYRSLKPKKMLLIVAENSTGMTSSK